MSYLQLAYVHLGAIIPTFIIGTYLLLNPKGSPIQTLLVKIYMVLMHKSNMKGLYAGGLPIAGAFTFMPSRLLHVWIFSA